MEYLESYLLRCLFVVRLFYLFSFFWCQGFQTSNDDNDDDEGDSFNQQQETTSERHPLKVEMTLKFSILIWFRSFGLDWRLVVLVSCNALDVFITWNLNLVWKVKNMEILVHTLILLISVKKNLLLFIEWVRERKQTEKYTRSTCSNIQRYLLNLFFC